MMRLDEAKLEALRRWGQGLRGAPTEEHAAAGRAILMLIEEVERLHLELIRTREQSSRVDPPGAEAAEETGAPLGSSLHRRLQRALGHDSDREGISIVECGGKPNIPLFVRICDAVHVPYVVVHDRDAMPGRKPIQAERAVNAAIAALAGPERTIELVPDFEGVAGLHAHSHKPAHAWRAYANADRARVPAALAEAIARVLELART